MFADYDINLFQGFPPGSVIATSLKENILTSIIIVKFFRLITIGGAAKIGQLCVTFYYVYATFLSRRG